MNKPQTTNFDIFSTKSEDENIDYMKLKNNEKINFTNIPIDKWFLQELNKYGPKILWQLEILGSEENNSYKYHLEFTSKVCYSDGKIRFMKSSYDHNFTSQLEIKLETKFGYYEVKYEETNLVRFLNVNTLEEVADFLQKENIKFKWHEFRYVSPMNKI